MGFHLKNPLERCRRVDGHDAGCQHRGGQRLASARRFPLPFDRSPTFAQPLAPRFRPRLLGQCPTGQRDGIHDAQRLAGEVAVRDHAERDQKLEAARKRRFAASKPLNVQVA